MKPFPYQSECINEIDWFSGRTLLAAEPGLGKTLISLLWVARHGAWPAVVVCPASVKWTWEREAKRAVGVNSLVAEGRKPPVLPPHPFTELHIINYDILRWWVDWYRSVPACGAPDTTLPKTIILDECQYVANPAAKRTKAVIRLCRNIPHVLALSGTPLVNRPIELWPMLNLLRPNVFQNKWAYAKRYCNARMTPWGWDLTGASRTAELHDLLGKHVMVRRRKVDVLPDLPPKLRSVVPIPMSEPKQYKQANDDFLLWLAKQDPKKAKRAANAEALVKVGYLLRLAAKLKIPAMMEWINDWLRVPENGKLLIFGEQREVIAEMRKKTAAWTLLIDGSVTGNKRRDAEEMFQNDQRYRVLYGNIRAAGVGLTLTAASTVVFAELSWRPGDLVQAEDRCHRIGTKDTVWAHYLVARGSIEFDLCAILQKKQAVLNAVLDGEDVKLDKLDVFDGLLTQLRNVRNYERKYR